MSSRTFGLIALVVIVGAMLLASRLDAAEAERFEMRYCENVATWQAQKARGVHPHDRTGFPDYKEIAADACPGLRPAR